MIGCGRAAAELHLPALRRIPEIVVVALCDVDGARLRQAARLAPHARCVADASDILSDTSVDAIAVCTPPAAHAALALAVMDAGKHLFVEKPLALTVSDCDAILARAARSEGRHVMGFNLRQHRLIQAAREVVRQGTLGTIQLTRSVFTTDIRLTRQLPAWRNERATGGGVTFEMATHTFDLWRWLLGQEVVQVAAVSGRSQAEDSNASVTAALSGGALASVQLSDSTTPLHQIEIFGERARLRLSLYDFDGLTLAARAIGPGSVQARLRGILHTFRSLPAGFRSLTSGGDYLATYRRQWRHYAATLLRGAPPAATLDDGRAAARIAIAAGESARSGRAVSLTG